VDRPQGQPLANRLARVRGLQFSLAAIIFRHEPILDGSVPRRPRGQGG
jgi:hypothetical protein